MPLVVFGPCSMLFLDIFFYVTTNSVRCQNTFDILTCTICMNLWLRSHQFQIINGVPEDCKSTPFNHEKTACLNL